jgi:Tfp pilus assembly protein PilN
MSIMSPENPTQTHQQPAPDPEPRPAARPAAAPSGPVRVDPLNLSRRPFLNSRPVVRVSLILWVLGLLLLLLNVSLFWNYLTSSEDKRAEIVQGEQEIKRGQAEVKELEARLDRIDLGKLNARILFLNGKIEERTFSWNLLLDRLAEVLPNDVRLNRLSPLTGDKAQQQTRGRGSRGTRRGQTRDGQVALSITGETRDDEALLRFVDNLFAHPAFADPNLIREERSEENNVVKFELTVQYVPGSLSQNVVIEEEAPTVVEEAPPSGAPAPGGPR